MTAGSTGEKLSDIEVLARLANEHQLAMHEVLAVMAGENIDVVRALTKLREKLTAEATKYLNTCPTEWPFRDFEWDVTREAQRFSLDGCSKKDFEKDHPNGFELGSVKTAELNSLLCHFSHRKDEELWTVGSESKLAYVIAYIADGRPLSPPIIKPLDDGTVIITGGHHRYAVAWALRTERLPMLAYSEAKERLNQLLKIEWRPVDA